MELKDIKELKSKTGCGYGKCKKALEESNGNIEEAILWLQTREPKASAGSGDSKAEGYIATYIHHNGKLVAVVELLCETDFLARSTEFRELTEELAVHVAGAKPIVVSMEEAESRFRERLVDSWIGAAIEDGKSTELAAKITAGKWKKWCKESILPMQSLITREDKTTVEQALNLICTASGERVRIGRFHRMEIGV